MLVYNAGLITSPPPLVVRSIAMSVYVCLFVCLCLLSCLKHHTPNFTTFSVRITRCHSWVLFWRQWNTFSIVMFSYNGPYGVRHAWQYHTMLSILWQYLRRSPAGASSQISNVFPRLCSTVYLVSYTIAANCTPGAKSAVCDCLVWGHFPIFTHMQKTNSILWQAG